jgi:hypothetical protein
MKIFETILNSAFYCPFLGPPLLSIMRQKLKGPKGQDGKTASHKPRGIFGGIHGLPQIARTTAMKWTKNFPFRGCRHDKGKVPRIQN